MSACFVGNDGESTEGRTTVSRSASAVASMFFTANELGFFFVPIRMKLDSDIVICRSG